MKNFIFKLFSVFTVIGAFFISTAQAQCAMCSLTAQAATENGNTQGFGLNDGIVFLLFMPYLAVIVIGLIWYKKYRKKPSIGKA